MGTPAAPQYIVESVSSERPPQLSSDTAFDISIDRTTQPDTKEAAVS